MFRNLWRTWLKPFSRSYRGIRRTPSKPRGRRVLALEALEDRIVPSTFNAPVTFPLPGSPDAVATGHFRGASAPLDVVTTNFSVTNGTATGTLSVLLGNGDGTLQSPENINLGAVPVAVTVGDLLGNGRQDIVTTNTNGTLSVLLSNPDGTFQSPETITLGGHLTSTVVGDFFGDGHLSLAVNALNNSHTSVSVLRGNGDGTFGSPITTQNVTADAVGDFTGRGKLDIASAAGSSVEVLPGNGDGTFGAPILSQADLTGFGVVSLQTADLNGDGKLDLVAITPTFQAFGPHDNIDVLLGNGDGTFQRPVTYQVGNNAGSLVLGDFTGHGKPDIAVTDNSGIDVLVSNGDGTFQNARTVPIGASFPDNSSPTFLATGDFLGDGKSDLVLASRSSQDVGVLVSNGDGSFSLPPVFASGLNSEAVATGDLTGSGKQDIVQVDGSGHVNILLNSGDGTFRNGTTLDIPHAVVAHPFGPNLILSSVVVGDFTGNGKQDIAVLTYDEQADRELGFVYLGNGDGTFQAPISLNLSQANIPIPTTIVAGNFAGNGRQDLAVLSYVGVYQLQVFLSNGDGTFTPEAPRVVSDDYVNIAVADLRGNGKQDIVLGSFPPTFFTPLHPMTSDGKVMVMLNNGDGTFQDPVTVASLGVRIASLAVADFNGDGHPDIVATRTDGAVSVLLGNGDGTFQSPITSRYSSQSVESNGGVAVGDFFGDGHLSLALTGFINGAGANSVLLLRGRGDGTFQADTSYLATGIVAAGDFTGHGVRDLVEAGSNISVLLNQGNSSTVTGAPTLQSVVLNDGTSTAPVTSLTVTLGPGITLDPGAIRLQGPGGAVSVNVATSVVGGNTVATVTFPGLPGGALPAGSYTLTVVGSLTHNSQGQTFSSDATANFTAEDIVPDVESVMVNDGSTPDAPVTSLTVTFNEVVSLDLASFTLLASDGTPVDVQVTSSVVNGRTVAVLSFGAALADGSYALTIRSSGVQDSRNHTLATDFETDFAVSGGLVAGDGILFQLPE
jgi:hypothetical protein